MNMDMESSEKQPKHENVTDSPVLMPKVVKQEPLVDTEIYEYQNYDGTFENQNGTFQNHTGTLENHNFKQEPLEYVKTDDLAYQNYTNNVEKQSLSTSIIWSMLVSQCRYLLQEEYEFNQMNSTLMTKILVKEVNHLLVDIVNFFHDCCHPLNQEEICSENSVEVDGLLVNILPCHPQNLECFYRVRNDIPQEYLGTLFSPLDNEIENDKNALDFPFNHHLLIPNIEVDIKKEPDFGHTVKKVKRGRKPKGNNEKPWKCKKCLDAFKTKVELRAHKKDGGCLGSKENTEKPQKPHMCEICGKEFRRNKELKEHVSGVHEKNRNYKCDKCGDTYRHRGGLAGHKKDGRCPGAPRPTRKLIYWGKGTSFDRPKCIHPDCVDKELPEFNFDGIMNHVIELHSPDPDDSKNLQCPDCPLRFPMASVLKYHREREHGAKVKVCNICGKSVVNMKQHILLIHNSEKLIQCDKCDFRTNHKRNLERHMNTHSDDPMAGKKFVCQICLKAFSKSDKLKEHILVHGGIKPYKCNLCNAAFSNFSGHRQHMMKTHGIKFTCDICGKDSSSIKGLGIHKRDKHGIPM